MATNNAINRSTPIPAFLANLSVAGTVSNVTGDGTGYTILFDTVIFDTTSSYNPVSGFFTAPVDGIYQFNITIMATNSGSGNTTTQINIVSPSNIFNVTYINGFSSQAFGNFLNLSGSSLVPLNAADTVQFKLISAGGAKQVGVLGNTIGPSDQGFTFVSGYLIS